MSDLGISVRRKSRIGIRLPITGSKVSPSKTRMNELIEEEERTVKDDDDEDEDRTP